ADLLGNPRAIMDLLRQADALLLAEPPNLLAASALLVQARDALAVVASGTIVRAQVKSLLDSATSLLPDPVDPGTDPTHPLGPPLRQDERVAVDGAQKTPSLRNSELTAPYFHNGGMSTLEQVVAFYNRGGDFAVQNQDNLDPDIAPIGLSREQK